METRRAGKKTPRKTGADRMTIIAWDGKSVAADTMSVSGHYRCPDRVHKIVRNGEFVYGMTGWSAWFDAWIKWHRDGADPAKIPASGIAPGDSGAFLVFGGGKAMICSALVPYLQETGAPDAWGSACDFAIGAMVYGASAKQAVEVAIVCSTSAGGSVDVIEL